MKIFFLLLLITLSVQCEYKEYIREYSYEGTVHDTKESARALALSGVKELLLKEVQNFIVSKQKVVDELWYEEDVLSLVLGITKTKIIEEKWDGTQFWLKAKVAVDSDEMKRQLDMVLANRGRLHALRASAERSAKLLKENQELQRKLQLAKTEDERAVLTKLFLDKKRAVLAEYWFHRAMGEQTTQLKIEAFSKAIEHDSTYDFAYNNRAVEYHLIKEYDNALFDYQKAIALRPTGPTAFYNRAILYDDLGKVDEAIADYSMAIQNDPRDANLYRNRGSVYKGIGAFEKALDDYNNSLLIQPDSAFVFALRGTVYEKLHFYKKALQDYDMAIAKAPTDVMLLTYRYLFYISQKSYKKAEADCRASIKISPSDKYLWLDLGKILTEREKYSKAEAAFKKALLLDEDFLIAYYYYGKTLSFAGKSKESNRMLNIYIANETLPSATERVKNLAIVVRKQGGTPAASPLLGAQ